MSTQPVPTFPIVAGLESFYSMDLNDLVHAMGKLEVFKSYLDITKFSTGLFTGDGGRDLNELSQETIDYLTNGIALTESQRDWLILSNALSMDSSVSADFRYLVNASVLTTLDFLS